MNNNTKEYQNCLFNRSILLCKNIKLQIAELEQDIYNLKYTNIKKIIPPAGMSSHQIIFNNPNINWGNSLRN
ncbi:MAG: hypothetical protein CXT73_04570 [Methanobacteriota archaeon]|nr:MAG: hypothetical protein CXT73_04570 [Euryarchaeota archaeon]